MMSRGVSVFMVSLWLVLLAACGGNAAPTAAPPLAPTRTVVSRVPPPVVTATVEPPTAIVAATLASPATATILPPGQTAVPAAPVPAQSPFVGSYSAILPTADAPGRIFTLDLAVDGAANMTTQFIGKGGPSAESGTWSQQGNQAIVAFTQKDGKPEDNRITWQLNASQLVAVKYDQTQYGSAGLALTRVGTGDLGEANFGGVSFSFDRALAQSTQGAALSPIPVQQAPALGGGAPAGIRFNFDDAKLPEYFDPRQPQVYVYPVAGLQALDPTVAQGVASLQKILKEKPANPNNIFAFPLVPAAQAMRTNVHYLDTVNGAGIRFITYYSQDISPLTNGRILYTFQGITLDGLWYISVWWPITTPALPNPDKAPDTSHYDANQFETYLNNLVTTLNSLPNAGYVPNLSLLDNMVQSINAAPPLPTPTPTGAAAAQGTPTNPPGTTPGGQTLSEAYGGASIHFDPELAKSAQGFAIAAVPVDPTAPMLGGGAPEHIAFGFNGDKLTAAVSPFQPAVRIYPAGDLKTLDPFFAREIAALKTLLDGEPASVPDPIPILPPFNAQQVLHPQIKYLKFSGGTGVRIVTFYAQAIMPITNDGLFYTFQGLSADGKYYVTVFWNLRTDKLPNTIQDAKIADMDAWSRGFGKYLTDTDALLSSLAPEAFAPNLNLLDQLVQTIQLPQ